MVEREDRHTADEEEERRQVGFRMREARETAGLDRKRVADKLNVHTNSIARWETGGALPRAYNIRRLAQLTGVSEAWLRFGKAGRVAPGDVGDATDVDRLITMEALRTFVAEIGRPGSERARKLDALEGYRRLITTRDPLPSWWYELRELVDIGRL